MSKFARADTGSSCKLQVGAVGGEKSVLRVANVDISDVIDGKSPKWAGDGAGESQFAGGVKKEEHPFAGPISLAGVPQS